MYTFSLGNWLAPSVKHPHIHEASQTVKYIISVPVDGMNDAQSRIPKLLGSRHQDLNYTSAKEKFFDPLRRYTSRIMERANIQKKLCFVLQ